jgi:hypothetical protein
MIWDTGKARAYSAVGPFEKGGTLKIVARRCIEQAGPDAGVVTLTTARLPRRASATITVPRAIDSTGSEAPPYLLRRTPRCRLRPARCNDLHG